MVVKRFEVHLVNLDPTIGSEIKKTRPCVVVSPDEMNRHISTVIVAPMTATLRGSRKASRIPFIPQSFPDLVLCGAKVVGALSWVRTANELRRFDLSIDLSFTDVMAITVQALRKFRGKYRQV